VSYREHPVPRSLAPWVECAWSRVGGGDPVRVLPDGCIDIVWTEGSGTHFVGPNTSAFLAAPPAGARVVGVRLHPGAAPALLGVEAPALRDGREPLESLWGDAGRRLAWQLDSGDDRVGALIAALAGRAPAAPAPDPLVRAFALAPVPVAAAARRLHVSERQLRRRVEAAVGYGPKRLARVLRLHRALAAARAGDDLGRVALDAGYADQAHFANDCRTLAGVPPSALLVA
jgi:AraC-like DNA-binding protein